MADDDDYGKRMARLADKIVASAVHYLIQDQENDAALLLLFCEGTVIEEYGGGLSIELRGPRSAYDALNDQTQPEWGAVDKALTAVLGEHYQRLTVLSKMIDVEDPNWRAELLEIAQGRGVHNQGVEIPGRDFVIWKNLRFRSESERRVAAALDAAGALFLPNCLARLTNGARQRATRESDFLVCQAGKWGILEVDGPFHPRAEADHERDRLFRQYRIRVIERFGWERCYSDAPSVVQEFLTLLDKNG